MTDYCLAKRRWLPSATLMPRTYASSGSSAINSLYFQVLAPGVESARTVTDDFSNADHRTEFQGHLHQTNDCADRCQESPIFVAKIGGIIIDGVILDIWMRTTQIKEH
ncbi:MAG: hypothetical protein JOY97_07645 [Hyphomicrobiales bacterium]|nr:hypothetical protein [Hyphomicrobiales bacterium]